jgi:hypothetical protein
MLAKTNAVCVAVQAFQKATVTVKETQVTVGVSAEEQTSWMSAMCVAETGPLVLKNQLGMV